MMSKAIEIQSSKRTFNKKQLLVSRLDLFFTLIAGLALGVGIVLITTSFALGHLSFWSFAPIAFGLILMCLIFSTLNEV
jgi:fatty acid desaturase